MKKIFAVLFVFFAVAAVAFAEENTTTDSTIVDNTTIKDTADTIVPADDTIPAENSTEDESTPIIENVTVPVENATAPADDAAEELPVDDNSTAPADDAAEELPVDDNSTAPAENSTGNEGSNEDSSGVIDLCGEDVPAVTPDQGFLWGLKRAIERVDYSMTLGKSAKAKKGLVHAKERLCEVQLMIQEKKLDAAAKAKSKYEQTMNKTEEDISQVEDESDLKGIEEKIKEHRTIVTKMNGNMVKIKGTLTQEQQAAVQSLVESMNGSSNKVKIEINAKKEKFEIKIKAKEEKKEKADAELELEVEDDASEDGEEEVAVKELKSEKKQKTSETASSSGKGKKD